MKEIERPSKQVLTRARLTHWTEWQSRLYGYEMGAITEGNDEPTLFVAGEVLVGKEDRDLINECITKGGELITTPLAKPPLEIVRTREINTADFPRPVRIRFKNPVANESSERTLTELQERYYGRSRKPIISSDPLSASIASFAGRKSVEGRNILLNMVGRSSALPLTIPEENPKLGSPFPETWPSFQSPTRVVEAWQFVESVRVMRHLEPVVWIGILDRGFWIDENGLPIPGLDETASDFGVGIAGINLDNHSAPLGGAGGGDHPWHGHGCASVAAAIAGNKLGAAGTGGTVARPFLFRANSTLHHTVDCLNYATWWGIDIVNISSHFSVSSFLWWDNIPNLYDEAFKFAHDNGVIVIASAGNAPAGKNGERLPDLNIRPATRTPGVITVGALKPTSATLAGAAVELEAAPYSNYGPSVAIWAPGSRIMIESHEIKNDTFSGTSAAAPFVAGVAAMMRALDPGITPAKVKETLIRTGWKGPTDSYVTCGLDAFAAVLDVADNTLPADLGEPNHSPQAAAQLHQTGGSIWDPFFSVAATIIPGKVDYWKLDLTAISDVTIKLDWYHLLVNKLTLELTCTDTINESANDLARSEGRGIIVLRGTLSPGTYVLRISGIKLTAYELSVKSTRASIKADQFESNDSFAKATRLFFDPPSPSPFSLLKSWGPGDYEATLHRRVIPGVGKLAINPDFFELHVPVDNGKLISRVFIGRVDYPVNVALYNASYQLIQSWENQKQLSITPPAGTTCYLKISSPDATRYKISIGRFVDPALLPPEVDNAKSFPPWWKSAAFAVKPGINYFAIDVNPDSDDGNILFAPSDANFEMELLDFAGAIIRRGERDKLGQTSVGTAGLASGTYLIKVDYQANGNAPLLLQLKAPFKFD